MDNLKVVEVDMSEEMQKESLEIFESYIAKFGDKDLASGIKAEFDKRYGPNWHCIIGRNFACNVSSQTKHFIYLQIGQKHVVLYKSASG